jgi:hypothetical protein
MELRHLRGEHVTLEELAGETLIADRDGSEPAAPPGVHDGLPRTEPAQRLLLHELARPAPPMWQAGRQGAMQPRLRVAGPRRR